MSREEASTGNTTTLVFIICIVFIYLILCALYESLMIPFAVILSVPFGLMGSFLFAKLWGLENNIYMQTGLIMLIGLLAKTAILLTEYASERRRQGMSIATAAMSAAKARLRPILMTSMTNDFRYVTSDVRPWSGCQRKHIGRCGHGGRNAPRYGGIAFRGAVAVHHFPVFAGTFPAPDKFANSKVDDYEKNRNISCRLLLDERMRHI